MKGFSEKLKKRLKEVKITQEQLCHKIGMTRQGLNKSIENNSLQVQTVESICEVLEVSPDYFIDIQSRQNGVWQRLAEEANNEAQRWKMRAFELEEKLNLANFKILSKYVDPFFLFNYKGIY